MIHRSCVAREITASPQDIALLRRFYRTIYVPEFPDANERESIENMEQYLERKAEGWYQTNSYHILLYLDRGEPVAGVIIDYLAEANIGIIEFLVVSPSLRRSGLGSRLLTWAERTLNDDSRRAGRDGWAYLIAEMNDPFKPIDEADAMDPFDRAVIWHRWGFKKIRFPYVQPSLSPRQRPVRNLLLMCKPGAFSAPDVIPSAVLRDAVYGYARWAMRIDDPDHNAECREMARYLAGRQDVGLRALEAYVGGDVSLRLAYRELTAASGEQLAAVLDLYRHEFSGGPTALPPDRFKQFLATHDDGARCYDYHLLSISPSNDEPARGMASFFTLPGAGFGGYIVFDPAIRGQGYLSEVMTVIERRMISDGRGARGWYGECDPTGPAAQILAASGFYEVDVVYRQPPLLPEWTYTYAEAPVLRLVYKEFGEVFSPPPLAAEDLLQALRWIYRIVYGISHPEGSEYYRDVERQLRRSSLVAWKSIELTPTPIG